MKRTLHARYEKGPRGEPNALELENKILHFLRGKEEQKIRTITQELNCSRDRIYMALKKLARREQLIERKYRHKLYFELANKP